MRRKLSLLARLLLGTVLILATLCPARADDFASQKDYTVWRDLPALNTPTPLPADLNGRTVVLRWNGKHNSDLLLARLREHLLKAFPTAKLIVAYEKNPALSRVPPSIQDARTNVNGLLELSPDVVIAATGDCRTCAAWLAVEQVLLEEKGVATVTLLTGPFHKTFQAVRQNMRMAEMPCVLVPHPVGNLSADKVTAKADAAAEALLQLF